VRARERKNTNFLGLDGKLNKREKGEETEKTPMERQHEREKEVGVKRDVVKAISLKRKRRFVFRGRLKTRP